MGYNIIKLDMVKSILIFLLFHILSASAIIRYIDISGNGLIGGCPYIPLCGTANNGSISFGLYATNGLLLKSYEHTLTAPCGYALYIWANRPSSDVIFSALYKGEYYTGLNRLLLCPTDSSNILLSINGYGSTGIYWRSYPSHMRLIKNQTDTSISYTSNLTFGSLTLFTDSGCVPNTSYNSLYTIESQIYGTLIRSSIVWKTAPAIPIIDINFLKDSQKCAYTLYENVPIYITPYVYHVSYICAGTVINLPIVGRYSTLVSVYIEQERFDCKIFTHWSTENANVTFTNVSIQTIRDMNTNNYQRYWYSRRNITIDDIDTHENMVPIYDWGAILDVTQEPTPYSVAYKGINYIFPKVPCNSCSEHSLKNILTKFSIQRYKSLPNLYYECEIKYLGTDGFGPTCAQNIDCITLYGTSSASCNITSYKCIVSGDLKDLSFLTCILNVSESFQSYNNNGKTFLQELLIKYGQPTKSNLLSFLNNKFKTTIIEGPNRCLYMNNRLNINLNDNLASSLPSFTGGRNDMDDRRKYMIIYRKPLLVPSVGYIQVSNRLDIFSLITDIYSLQSQYDIRSNIINRIIYRNVVPAREYVIVSEYCSSSLPDLYLPIWEYDVIYTTNFSIWNITGQVAVTTYFDKSILVSSLNTSTSYIVCSKTCNSYTQDNIFYYTNSSDTRCKICADPRPAYGFCPDSGGKWEIKQKIVLNNVTSVYTSDFIDSTGILLNYSVLIIEGNYYAGSVMYINYSNVYIDKSINFESNGSLILKGSSSIVVGTDIILNTSENIISIYENGMLYVKGNFKSIGDTNIILSDNSTFYIDGYTNNTIHINATHHITGLIFSGPTSDIKKYDVIISNDSACYALNYTYAQSRTSIWVIGQDCGSNIIILPFIIIGVLLIAILIVIIIFKVPKLRKKIFPFRDMANNPNIKQYNNDVISRYGFKSTTRQKGMFPIAGRETRFDLKDVPKPYVKSGV